MDKQKILIISRSFYPENSPRSFRTTELAKEFARKGCDVTVLTKFRPDFEYYGLEYSEKMNINNYGKLKFPILNYKFNNYLLKYFFRGLSRFLLLLFEYPAIENMFRIKKALKHESGYDLMISIASPYPVHWGTALARKKNQPIAKTWVADCGDPYYGRENDSFPVLFYFKHIEKWMFRKTDYIAIPVETAKDAYFKEFHKKIKIIPQGFNFEDIKLEKINHKNNIPTFAYAGNFIPVHRDPKLFIDYLLSLKIDFEFHIYTKMKDFINPLLKTEESKQKIILHDFIPRKQLLQEIQLYDFVVNIENRGVKQIPSKLIDYAIIQKPILNLKSQELDKDNIKRFLKGDYSKSYIVKNIDQYRIENVANQFLSLIHANENY